MSQENENGNYKNHYITVKNGVITRLDNRYLCVISIPVSAKSFKPNCIMNFHKKPLYIIYEGTYNDWLSLISTASEDDSNSIICIKCTDYDNLSFD